MRRRQSGFSDAAVVWDRLSSSARPVRPAKKCFCFEVGADDVVMDSTLFAVLHARMRAHLNRCADGQNATIPVGRFWLHADARLLIEPGGREIKLTRLEMNILKRLHRAGDTPVDRQTLLSDVWGHHTQLNTHTVETHIYRLRRKLGDADIETSTIRTVGHGYVLARCSAEQSLLRKAPGPGTRT